MSLYIFINWDNFIFSTFLVLVYPIVIDNKQIEYPQLKILLCVSLRCRYTNYSEIGSET